MNPRQPRCAIGFWRRPYELAQECCSHEHAPGGIARFRVSDIGDVRGQKSSALFRNGHRPNVLATFTSHFHESGNLIHRTHRARVSRSEGDRSCTGKCCHVDQQIGLLCAGRHKGVGQNEATLGIGIENLNRRAPLHLQDVVGSGSVTTRHVLGNG
jgi:hypothetical protein